MSVEEVPYFASLLKSGKYSDLVIKCGSKTFNVHKAIVCLQSPPFAAMIDGEFEEAKSGIIELREDHPAIVETAINFFYTKKYNAEEIPEDSGDDDCPWTPIVVNTLVYIFADKWEIPELKQLTIAPYKECLVGRILTEDDGFVKSLELLYDNTPETDRDLKEVSMEFAVSRARDLVKLKSFKALCRLNGDISSDILEALLDVTPASSFPKPCPNLVCGAHGSYKYVITNSKKARQSMGLYQCDICKQNFS